MLSPLPIVTLDVPRRHPHPAPEPAVLVFDSHLDLQKGGVRVGVATVLARHEQPITHPLGKTSPEACYAAAMSHLFYYKAMERAGYMTPIRTKKDLQQHLAECKANPGGVPFGY